MHRMDWPLFVSAFLSATLLPGGSEAVLMLRLQDAPSALQPILIATAGNLAGSLLTYAIGLGGNRALRRVNWLRIDQRDLARAERWFERWGRPSLLLAWLPVVGDPLCLLAGLLRVGWLSFVLLVGVGKLMRYALIAVFMA